MHCCRPELPNKKNLYLQHKYHDLVQLNNKAIGNFTSFNAKLFRKFTEQGLTKAAENLWQLVYKL